MKIVRIVEMVGVCGIALTFAAVSHAASWSMFSIEVEPEDAGKVIAAADKLMASNAGKELPGKLLLQSIVANGTDPSTHTFIPIYKNAANREAFVKKLQADAAWKEFQSSMGEISDPVSQVMYRTLKSWGDLAESDHVWMGHAFTVSDPPAFLAAIEALMASETGKKFPGQVYLSEVVAGGISPVTHLISVGYDSEAEMESWIAVRDASADWQTYLDTARKVSRYLGANMARDIKWWGPMTLKELAQ